MIVDLRSDTVTKPSPAMRRAMAEAEVGDDLFGEDPTVRRLEEAAAELVGKQASLFVPSGVMGNQIALHLLGRPGTEVACEVSSHIVLYEMGGLAVHSGLQARMIPSDGGVLDPAVVEAAIHVAPGYRIATSVLALENTHNMAGGRVTRPERMAALVEVAKRQGLGVHLDGARIVNAAVALGVPVAALAAGCDTVMFCLSKGLGAPVGSMLAGSAELVAQARETRRLFGGSMRQSGVLAAAGLVALEESPSLLATDHEHAQKLAECLVELPDVVLDPRSVETNVVVFGLRKTPATSFVARAAEAGLLCLPVAADKVRFVTHRDLSRQAIDTAVARLREL